MNANIIYRDVSIVAEHINLPQYAVECQDLSSSITVTIRAVLVNDCPAAWELSTCRRTWGAFRRGKSRRTIRRKTFATLEEAKAAAEKYVADRVNDLRRLG